MNGPGARPPRVVSLVPSITETLLSWGVSPVAVTRFCEAPGLPTVGGTKNPDLEAVVGLGPDAVLMDEEENRLPDFEALVAAGLTVVTTAVRSVADVPAALGRIAGAAGLDAPPVPGEEEARRPARPSGEPKRVFVPIWRRPWMTIGPGTYGSSLLREAGMLNCFEEADRSYPEVSPDTVRAARPDVVLAPSEPYPFKERHRRELEDLAGAPVEMVDGQDLFWWGTRTAGALGRFEQLAARLAGA